MCILAIVAPAVHRIKYHRRMLLLELAEERGEPLILNHAFWKTVFEFGCQQQRDFISSSACPLFAGCRVTPVLSAFSCPLWVSHRESQSTWCLVRLNTTGQPRSQSTSRLLPSGTKKVNSQSCKSSFTVHATNMNISCFRRTLFNAKNSISHLWN